MYRQKRETVPLYGSQLIIIVTDCPTNIKNKKGEKIFPTIVHDKDGYGASVQGQANDGTNYIWMFIHELCPDYKKYGVIAHESEHVKDYVFEQVGIEGNDSETNAYLLQWIFEAAYFFVMNVKKTKNKFWLKPPKL